MKEKKKQLIVVAFTFALLLLIGGTYAYFSINASNDKTGAKVSGKANNLGNPTMQTKTSKLYLNLDANLMSQANVGKTYYANEDESGLALTTNPNYVLAVAQLPEGDEALDCTYNYKVTATTTITSVDGSTFDVKVKIGKKEIDLTVLEGAGTTGIIVSGEIKNLTKGQSVLIPLSSSVTNTSKVQDGLVGNSYTISIEPYTNGDTKAFSCKLAYQIDSNKTFAQNLIDSKWLWQSGLEGDGYRYVGTNPDNFICFGTTDKTECIANQDKYMYRVIGIFTDSNGYNHAKLIKRANLNNAYVWNSDVSSDISWESSDLYKGLNGDYFLTNTEYDYLQNTTWNNRIDNWTWSTVNTYEVIDYDYFTPSEIYLHEMNRSAKTSAAGEWKTPSAKIGLMYVSDYALSLGINALDLTSDLHNRVLETGWMHLSTSDGTSSYEFPEWTISANGIAAWLIGDSGQIGSNVINNEWLARPVFYLTSDVKITADGDGSLENPFILE